jgi:hypothetical protein
MAIDARDKTFLVGHQDTEAMGKGGNIANGHCIYQLSCLRDQHTLLSVTRHQCSSRKKAELFGEFGLIGSRCSLEVKWL